MSVESPHQIPHQTTILIVGGGPAGSYAASVLQREGHQVTLLESAKFPRYHVGESMLPSLRDYLQFIGLEDDFINHGFNPKPGAMFKLVHGIDPTWTNFTALGPGYGTWNVIRSEMDEMLLHHARKQGVQVFEETTVDEIHFEGVPDSSRPKSASWSNKQGQSGKIIFEWLIDATGRSGLLSTKYLHNRIMRESLRNVAVWGYWKDVKIYGEGTEKEYSGWFEALTDETGWAWAIPLHDGTTSIGFVMHQTSSNAKRGMSGLMGKKMTLTEHYRNQLQFVPGVCELIGDKGHMLEGSTKSASDYSYFASRYSGDHFRIIGDAASFVDPFFSSGVHIAMTSALSAALTICASIRGQASEAIAQEWHDLKVGIAHTRFLFVVLGAYQQMHLQSTPILTSDFSAQNFDHAFRLFRPVIYGLADSLETLENEDVQQMMDTFQTLFDPRVSEEHTAAARRRYGNNVTALAGPIMGKQQIQQITGGDVEGQRVLHKFDALRVFGDDAEASSMGRQPLFGYNAIIEARNLGLQQVTQ